MRILSLCVLALALLTGAARAATLHVLEGPSPREVGILLQGMIMPGDDRRLLDLLDQVERKGLRVTSIGLKSPGGETNTGVAIAATVRARGLGVYLWSNCVSACAIIAIAAPSRIVTRSAKIGVHSAWRIGPNGRPVPAPDATAYVVRNLRGFGTPERVVRKIETTPWNRIALLDRGDLVALGTEVAPRVRTR
jgi:hypothetical protein